MEKESKDIKYSAQFYIDIVNIYLYGYETFGEVQANTYEEKIYTLVDTLNLLYDMYPECRVIPTKSRMYRNIILGSYLVIYRITQKQIEVLKVISSRMSISKIRNTRSIKV